MSMNLYLSANACKFSLHQTPTNTTYDIIYKEDMKTRRSRKEVRDRYVQWLHEDAKKYKYDKLDMEILQDHIDKLDGYLEEHPSAEFGVI